jgi:predicted nuclease with TOPRIM domain
MSDYLARIGEELKYQLLCECKIQKIEDYHNLTHKISFLREENHKFFRMIEEKTEECEELRLRIDHLEASNSEKHHEETPLTDHHKSRLPFASMLSEEITSRIISSNSSRVS